MGAVLALAGQLAQQLGLLEAIGSLRTDAIEATPRPGPADVDILRDHDVQTVKSPHEPMRAAQRDVEFFYFDLSIGSAERWRRDTVQRAVLVADDEPGLVTIVRQLMERSGADVSIANGGTAALEALQAPGAKFDVVITDLDMPLTSQQVWRRIQTAQQDAAHGAKIGCTAACLPQISPLDPKPI